MTIGEATSVVSVSQDGLALRVKSCFKSMVWLLLVSLGAFAACAAFAFPRHGWSGVTAAALATLIVGCSAAAALWSTGITVGTPKAMQGMFLGVFLRTVVPFLLSILMTQAFSPLADAGLFGMVLINFLVMLTVETFLVVRIVQTHAPAAQR